MSHRAVPAGSLVSRIITAADGTTSVHASGELDIATAHDLAETLANARADGRPIVVDLSDVSFLDSSGLSVLLRFGPEELAIVPSAEVARVVDLCGVRDRMQLLPGA